MAQETTQSSQDTIKTNEAYCPANTTYKAVEVKVSAKACATGKNYLHYDDEMYKLSPKYGRIRHRTCNHANTKHAGQMLALRGEAYRDMAQKMTFPIGPGKGSVEIATNASSYSLSWLPPTEDIPGRKEAPFAKQVKEIFAQIDLPETVVLARCACDTTKYSDAECSSFLFCDRNKFTDEQCCNSGYEAACETSN